MRESVALALRFAAGDADGRAKVEALAERHSQTWLNVLPELYPLWLGAWIDTMSELDPQWNGKLEGAWREQLQPIIEAMKSKYDVPVAVGV